MADGHAPIIIKKVKKGGHGGHHGGAWKVAYADFVTAMMAFFLLLWLLNATSSDQKIGIANYFDPTAISSSSSSGAGGAMGGRSASSEGSMTSDSSPPSINDAAAKSPPAPESEGGDKEGSGSEEGKLSSESDALEAREGPGELKNAATAALRDPQAAAQQAVTGSASGSSQTPDTTAQNAGVDEAGKLLSDKIDELETKKFEKFEKELREVIDETILSDPNLLDAARNLKIDSVPEGLRIQLIDQEKMAFFPSGSAEMFDATRVLLGKVSQLLAKMPNNIKISGHTDATKFAPGSTYTNWELSADRALASRRALIASGINNTRITEVVGRADREPIMPENPSAATNRRISIVLVRQTADDSIAVAAAEAALRAEQ